MLPRPMLQIPIPLSRAPSSATSTLITNSDKPRNDRQALFGESRSSSVAAELVHPATTSYTQRSNISQAQELTTFVSRNVKPSRRALLDRLAPELPPNEAQEHLAEKRKRRKEENETERATKAKQQKDNHKPATADSNPPIARQFDSQSAKPPDPIQNGLRLLQLVPAVSGSNPPISQPAEPSVPTRNRLRPFQLVSAASSSNPPIAGQSLPQTAERPITTTNGLRPFQLVPKPKE